MSKEFQGTVDDLKALVLEKGIFGDWEDDGAGKYTFRSNAKGILNFWPHKGTVQCQGKTGPKAELDALFDDGGAVKVVAKAVPVSAPDNGTKIFVVHGHDTPALEQLELVLRRLGLDPYILQNNDGQSKTLIEALEQQIYKESAFGIILLTPDDYGYPKSESEDVRQPRARPRLYNLV